MVARFPLEYPAPPQTSPLVPRSTRMDIDQPCGPAHASCKVSFASSSPQMHTFEYDHTPEEARACWYTAAEYDAMKRHAVDCVKRHMRGQPVRCMLGLEGYTIQGQQARETLLFDTTMAVHFGKTVDAKARVYQAAGATQAARAAAWRGAFLAARLEKKRLQSELSTNAEVSGEVIRSKSRRKKHSVPLVICI